MRVTTAMQNQEGASADPNAVSIREATANHHHGVNQKLLPKQEKMRVLDSSK